MPPGSSVLASARAMRLNIPNSMPARSRRSSGDQRASHDEDAGASSGPDIEALPYGKLENGLLGLAHRRKFDVMYMISRRFSEQTLFCLHAASNRIERCWEEVTQDVTRNSPDLDDKARKLQREICDYQQLMIQTETVQKFENPDKRFLAEFVENAKPQLSRADAAFLGGPLEDWVMLHGLDRLDRWVRTAAEYPLGAALLRPWRTDVTSDEGYRYQTYPVRPFKVLLSALVNCTLAAFLGVPVALQAMNVTTTGAYVGTYVAFLFVFGVVIQAMVAGHMIQVVLSLAYAAVLVANMKED
ncbi:hypothetical protein FDECE_14698 [Fusarium decemcellulare]|nr:hypothetical protein FDECE_14698 [Fusarium decemcellulare]